MSAVSRVLEVPRKWVENDQAVRASPVSRWGPPIWPEEQHGERMPRVALQPVSLEVVALAFLHTSRGS